jgi:hypothetical protein
VPTSLVDRACANVAKLCAKDETECLRQINQLRNAPYATLSDSDLECWANAKDKATISACPGGVCR